MRQFFIRGIIGAVIGYSLPVSVLLSFGWLGINPPPATVKAWAMFLNSQPAAFAGTIAGGIVGLLSAALHQHLTKRSN